MDIEDVANQHVAQEMSALKQDSVEQGSSNSSNNNKSGLVDQSSTVGIPENVKGPECTGDSSTTQTMGESNVTAENRTNLFLANPPDSTGSSEEIVEMEETKVGDTDGQESNGIAGITEIEIKQEPATSLDNSINNLSSLSKSLVGVMSSTDTAMGSLVAYGSSDEESGSGEEAGSEDSSSSSDSESSSSSVNDGEKVPIPKEGSRQNTEKAQTEGKPVTVPPPRGKRELMLQDLPEVPFVDFRLADNEEVALLGKVSSIIGQLVVVASNRNTPALNEETVLFKEDRHPIGVVFEIFGPVPNPFYQIRFNSTKEITDRSLVLGSDVYYAPKQEEITNYVFVKQLEAMRGSDASWANDEEPPPAFLDYSDDESERKAKKDRVMEREKRKAAARGDDGESSTSGGQTTRPARQRPGKQDNANRRRPDAKSHQNGGPAYSQSHNQQSPRQPFNHRGPAPPFRHRGPPPHSNYRAPALPFNHGGPPPPFGHHRGTSQPPPPPDQRGNPWAFDPRGPSPHFACRPQHFENRGHGPPFNSRGTAPDHREFHHQPTMDSQFGQQPWQQKLPPPPHHSQFAPGAPPPGQYQTPHYMGQGPQSEYGYHYQGPHQQQHSDPHMLQHPAPYQWNGAPPPPT